MDCMYVVCGPAESQPHTATVVHTPGPDTWPPAGSTSGLLQVGNGGVSLASWFLKKSRCDIYQTDRLKSWHFGFNKTKQPVWPFTDRSDLLVWCQILGFPDGLSSRTPDAAGSCTVPICISAWSAGRSADKQRVSHNIVSLVFLLLDLNSVHGCVSIKINVINGGKKTCLYEAQSASVCSVSQNGSIYQ